MHCEFGDVVLVPVPYTDQTASKKRPAVVVSSPAAYRQRREIVVMAITSQVPQPERGEFAVASWQEAGLLAKPSCVKPIFATIDRDLILKRLGRLTTDDRSRVEQALRRLLGPANAPTGG